MEKTKQPRAAEIVIQRYRIAVTSRLRNPVMMRLGLSFCFLSRAFRRQTPSQGANRTATNQETINAIETTAKIENVYSPAEERAKPIGTKPAAVTKEPVGIGKAGVS